MDSPILYRDSVSGEVLHLSFLSPDWLDGSTHIARLYRSVGVGVDLISTGIRVTVALVF